MTNPYLGLQAFSYNDRAIYAGREQLAKETVQRLPIIGINATSITDIEDENEKS